MMNNNFESYADNLDIEKGEIPVSSNGVYDYPYQNVIVPTGGNITMKDVEYPILGVSMETGQRQMMLPGDNYNFENTQNVLEIPQYQDGGKIYGTGDIEEINLKAPYWNKYRQEYLKENTKEAYIQNYLDSYRYAGQSQQNYPSRLDEEYENRISDYVGEQIAKNNPKGDRSREQWLNSLSKKEQELVQRNPKHQTSLWQDTVEGGKSFFNLLDGQKSRIERSSNYSNLEKKQLLEQHKTSPVLSSISDMSQILSGLSVPSKIVQSTLRPNYSLNDAVSGRKNKASVVEDILTDPTTWLGVGYTDDILKGVGKLGNKLGVSNKVKNSTRVVEMQEGINSLKKPNWEAWNKEIPKNTKLLDEYQTIEQNARLEKNWMKNGDGSLYKGTPEQFIQEKSTNFKKAFDDSLIREKQYHTTDGDFTEFDPSRSPSKGVYFTTDKAYTEDFPRMYRPETAANYKVGEYYLSAKKGYTIPEAVNHGTIDHYASQPFFKKSGTDLLRGKETTPFGFKGKQDINVVFDPKQIKSAQGNNGMFDLSNPNMYKSLAIPLGLGATTYSVGNNTPQFQDGGQVKAAPIAPVTIRNIGKYSIGLDNVENTIQLEDYERKGVSSIQNFEEYVMNEYRDWGDVEDFNIVRGDGKEYTPQKTYGRDQAGNYVDMSVDSFFPNGDRFQNRTYIPDNINEQISLQHTFQQASMIPHRPVSGNITEEGMESQRDFMRKYVGSDAYKDKLSSYYPNATREQKDRLTRLNSVDLKITPKNEMDNFSEGADGMSPKYTDHYGNQFVRSQELGEFYNSEGSKDYISENNLKKLESAGIITPKFGIMDEMKELYNDNADNKSVYLSDKSTEEAVGVHEMSHYMKQVPRNQYDDITSRISNLTDPSRIVRLEDGRGVPVDYTRTPTEVTSRLDVLRYLMNQEGIKDTTKSLDISNEELEKALQNPRIKNNGNVKDLINSAKNSQDLLWLLNNIVDNSKPNSNKSFNTA